MIHTALISPRADRLEQIDRLQAGLGRHARRAPEAADAVDVGRREVHVRGQRVGKRADLAAAHGVGLAGDRERPHARPADAAGQQMAIDDGVDLVDAGARLVDALRIERDGLLGLGEPVEEGREVGRRQVAVGEIAGARRDQRVVEAARVALDEALVPGAAPVELGQQAVEQGDVAAGPQRQVQIGDVAGLGAARIDHDDLHGGRARLAASRRWNSTGWHQARLLPTSTTRSASSKSS